MIGTLYRGLMSFRASSEAEHTAGASVAGMGMVTAGSMFANVAAYLLQVLASRMLGVEGYGEFASLLAAQLVLAVPALALQSVVAREVVRGRSSRELRTVGYRCAAVVGVLALALAPALSAAMDISMAATVSAVIAAPVLVLLAAEQGLLQGRGRFGALSVVLAAAGFGKVAPAVLVLVLGGGPGSVLLATAAGIGVVALGARWTAGVPVNSVSETKVTVLAVLQASQVQLVLIAMSALDLVLARTLLSSNEAGLYAVGAVASKAAFWLPQASASFCIRGWRTRCIRPPRCDRRWPSSRGSVRFWWSAARWRLRCCHWWWAIRIPVCRSTSGCSCCRVRAWPCCRARCCGPSRASAPTSLSSPGSPSASRCCCCCSSRRHSRNSSSSPQSPQR